MIPISIPNLTGNEAAYLESCVETGFVSSVGDYVGRFAVDVAARSGGAYATPTSSGTAALHLALLGVGVGRDDLVVVPSLTFIASANAISYCGAIPWLFDVTQESWTLDPLQLGSALERDTEQRGGSAVHRKTGRRIAAIMPVHMLGTPADMDALITIAGDHNIPVVCDAAAALGARYKGQPIGGLDVAASAFSFNGNKTFTCGGGGAVVSNDQALVDDIGHLATTARIGPDYDHDQIGFNYRMTNLNAAVGCAQLERYEEFLAQKIAIAMAYDDAFSAMELLQGFPEPDWASSARWLSGVYLDAPADKAVAFVAELRTAGIDARQFWKPLHKQQPYAQVPKAELSVTEQLSGRIIPLPCSTQLTESEQDQVIETVRKISRNF